MILHANSKLDKCCTGCGDSTTTTTVGFINGTCTFGIPGTTIDLCPSVLSIPTTAGTVSGGTSVIPLAPGSVTTLSPCNSGTIQVLQVPPGHSIYYRHRTPTLNYPCTPTPDYIQYSYSIVSISNSLGNNPSVVLRIELSYNIAQWNTTKKEVGLVTIIGTKPSPGVLQLSTTLHHSYEGITLTIPVNMTLPLSVPESITTTVNSIPDIPDHLIMNSMIPDYVLKYYLTIIELDAHSPSSITSSIKTILEDLVPVLPNIVEFGTLTPPLFISSIKGRIITEIISSTESECKFIITGYYQELSPMVVLMASTYTYPIEVYNPLNIPVSLSVFQLSVTPPTPLPTGTRIPTALPMWDTTASSDEN